MDINAAKFTEVQSALHDRGVQTQHLKPKTFLNYSSFIKGIRLKLKHQYHIHIDESGHVRNKRTHTHNTKHEDFYLFFCHKCRKQEQ